MYQKALIIALNENWTGISRLPEGLKRAGFETYALCPKKSFLAKTRHLKGGVFYPVFSYSRSKLIYLWILYAISVFKPDIIIPGDEDAILALHRLANFFEGKMFFSRISKLIRLSLTPKELDSLILSKSSFQERCRELGLRTPKNIIVKDLASAITEADKLGYPVVVKSDSGYGGSGVCICSTPEEMKKHFASFKNESFLNILKTFFKNLFFISIFISEKKISLQQYIEGTVGQSPFCAKEGKVFAFNPMLRLETFPGKTGPASVSMGYENPDTEKFLRSIAKDLSYTGFGSLEYIIERESGLLYIIELNPRPTPTCHISENIVANDLGKAFYHGINTGLVDNKPFKPFTIAMFPGERRRDPKSKYLVQAFHDVPSDDPKLLSAMMSII